MGSAAVGALTEQLSVRCDHVTAIDIAEGALTHADARLRRSGHRDDVTLLRRAFDMPWPAYDFDLVVISEIAYDFDAPTLRATLDRELPRLHSDATVIAAHWRHPVADYPLSGDAANAVIAVFDTRSPESVAARTAVPGA